MIPDEIKPTTAPPIQLNSLSGCSVDLDCAIGLHCFESICVSECDESRTCASEAECSVRGRCLIQQKELQGTERLNVYLNELPEKVQLISKNQARLNLSFGLAGPDAQSITHLAYHIESDNPKLNSRNLYKSVVDGGQTTITVDLNSDGRDLFDGLEEEFTSLRLITEAGEISFSLVRKPSISGVYASQVKIDRFGGVPFATELQIVTSPEDVALEDAERAWLLMPQGRDHIFSPLSTSPIMIEVEEPLRWVASPLAFDELTEQWFAVFDYSFPFEESSHFYHEEDTQIQRSIRVDFVIEEDQSLYGLITDRWSGIYESRTPNGVSEQPVVSFDGEFTAIRVSKAISAAEVIEVPSNAAQPGRLSLPSLEGCEPAFIASSCAGVSGAQEFISLADDARASCAISAVDRALETGSTTSMILEFFDGDNETPNGMSFAEFMEACALGTDGICIPKPEVLCARSLTAYAFVAPERDTTNSAELIAAYQRATRESFLGRQLAALQADTDARLTWLRSSDYPAIITSVLKDHTEGLMNSWVERVLNVHLSVLSGQFDEAGLALLSRQPTNEAAQVARRELLFEMSQTWRATMESLTLATVRWNQLFQDAERRAEYTALISEKMFELYLIAGVAGNLNLRAGAGFANATFAGGFAALSRELGKLSLPFDQLIYARDAEVVLSRSLDPQSDQFNLLSQVETLAREAISDSSELVQVIIAESTERELSQAQIQNRLINEINVLRGEVLNLCGLPIGCSLSDYTDRPECAPRILDGECGFGISNADGAVVDLQTETPSEAGAAILKIKEAILNVSIAKEEVRALRQQADLELASAQAFSQQIELWNQARITNLAAVDRVITQREGEWSQAMQEIGRSIKQRNMLRQSLAQDALMDARNWQSIRVSGISSDFSNLREARALESTAGGLLAAADKADELAEASVSGLPTSVGLSNDPSFAARLAIKMSKIGVTKVMRVGALASQSAASKIRTSVDKQSALRDAVLANFRDQDIGDDLEVQAEIEELADQAALDLTEQQVIELQVDRVITQMVAVREAELAYKRDIVELRDRRDQVYATLIREGELLMRVEQAELAVQQRVLEYLQITQRAGLISEQLNNLENQRQNINLIIGSPSVVFAWANRLAQAENKLKIAKERLLDWLVALEYYAVRPFMDQRIQILLSQNPYQLEAIADELLRLKGVCGGSLNEQAVTLSLRDHLKLNESLIDPVSGEEVSAQARFLTLLREKNISASKRTRVGANLNIGELLSSDQSLGLTFKLDLDRFANLSLSCNAKIKSIDVSLIGDGLGSGLPAVSIIYSGASQMRSCQPEIQSYVDLFGEGATAFGEVTTFRSPTRSISPVAGLNSFPSQEDGTGNLSLSGLPLSSEYTVLIDMNSGDNAEINWEALSDIELKINYLYQDFFATGECQ